MSPSQSNLARSARWGTRAAALRLASCARVSVCSRYCAPAEAEAKSDLKTQAECHQTFAGADRCIFLSLYSTCMAAAAGIAPPAHHILRARCMHFLESICEVICLTTILQPPQISSCLADAMAACAVRPSSYQHGIKRQGRPLPLHHIVEALCIIFA